MKKVLSIFVAAMACAVMLVSCAKSNFQNEVNAMNKAAEAKDYATIVTNANTILNGIDKAAAGDLVCAGTMLNTVVTLKQQEGSLDPQEAINLFNQVSKALEAAKSKSDYDATVATFKGAGVDVEALAASIPNAIASYQAVLDADAQQAEATEAEGEGDAEEGAEDAE